MIFVGAIEAQLSEAMLTACHMTQSLDLQLKNFLDAEAAIVLNDNPCVYCFDRMGCVGCKKMGNPASYEELEEDKVIREAIQINPDGNAPGRFKLSVDYPTKPGVDLAYIYSASRSNRHMAAASSESLRKKLLKDGKLQAFHEKEPVSYHR